MATREEEHSTRGRARLLFEMFQGEAIADGWKNDAVKEALDLCLACKGCKGDCPVNVDMATYKAEFLSHYYEGRLRPLAAPTRWAGSTGGRASRRSRRGSRTASRSAGLGVVSALGGIAPRAQDADVRAARPSARGSGRARAPEPTAARASSSGPTPSTTTSIRRRRMAAVEVLEARRLPGDDPAQARSAAAGRSTTGLLELAKKLLREILDALRPEIDAGVADRRPRAELRLRVPRRAAEPLPERRRRAKRLAKPTMTLSEFLAREGDRSRCRTLRRQGARAGALPPQRDPAASTPRRRCCSKLGLDVERPDSGCCGMAGAFGFEARATTRSRCASASACCCRGARGVDRTRSSSPTASAAASRSPR